jgi:hypothetical protein
MFRTLKLDGDEDLRCSESEDATARDFFGRI